MELPSHCALPTASTLSGPILTRATSTTSSHNNLGQVYSTCSRHHGLLFVPTSILLLGLLILAAIRPPPFKKAQLAPKQSWCTLYKTCPICERKQRFADFTKHSEASKCAHDGEVCISCWKEWLEAQITSKRFDQIQCVLCNNVLAQSDIKALATAATFEQYLDMSLKSSMADILNFRWCIRPGCKSGQLHEGGDIFRCVECQHKACATCNVAWHEGETCEAHQASLAKRTDEEAKSAIAVEIIAKLCPSCNSKLEKTGGCDHKTCRMCRYQFCWVCLADHHPIFRQGNHMHQTSCVHYRAPEGRHAVASRM